MVSRRRILRRLPSATVGVGLAGCTGGRVSTVRAVGESVTYGGLQMAVTRVATARELTTVGGSDGDDERDVTTPQQGSTFALAYLRVRNLSDAKRAFPRRRSQVNLLLSGSETTDRLVSGPLDTDDGPQQVYRDSMADANAAAGAPPGTVVRGWTVFELPRRFERSDAVVTVRHAGPSAESRRLRWRFDG